MYQAASNGAQNETHAAHRKEKECHQCTLTLLQILKDGELFL